MPKWTIVIESDDPEDEDYIAQDATKEIALNLDEDSDPTRHWSVTAYDESGKDIGSFQSDNRQ